MRTASLSELTEWRHGERATALAVCFFVVGCGQGDIPRLAEGAASQSPTPSTPTTTPSPATAAPTATTLPTASAPTPTATTMPTVTTPPTATVAPTVTTPPTATAAPTPEPTGAFTLTSPAFDDVAGCSDAEIAVCDEIPVEHSSFMGSPDTSPEFSWTSVPAGTMSFAITLFDVTFGQPHWVMWDIPGSATGLPAALEEGTATPTVPAGSRQASATFAPAVGYFGPQAPCNVFQFEVYALSIATFEPEEPELAALVRTELQELGPEVLGRATITARTNYECE